MLSREPSRDGSSTASGRSRCTTRRRRRECLRAGDGLVEGRPLEVRSGGPRGRNRGPAMEQWRRGEGRAEDDQDEGRAAPRDEPPSLGGLDTPDGPGVVRHSFPMSGTCPPRRPWPGRSRRPSRTVLKTMSPIAPTPGRSPHLHPLLLRARPALLGLFVVGRRPVPAARLGAALLARTLVAPGRAGRPFPPPAPAAEWRTHPRTDGARREGRGESAGVLGEFRRGRASTDRQPLGGGSVPAGRAAPGPRRPNPGRAKRNRR